MKKKILVTGASGFVGSHLVEAACLAGFEVHAAVRKSSQVSEITPFVTKFIYPDFNDSAALADMFATGQYDYAIHAAAMTKAKTHEQLVEVNVGVTHRFLQGAFSSEFPPKRVVFVSSLAAIGPVAYTDQPITENSPYHPVTDYGRSKQAAEEMIREQFADKPITVIRPTAVYGPREKDLFILFETMNKGLDAYIGTAPQKLTFVYVKDLVDVLLRACVSEQHGLTTFNITDGEVYSRYDMADVFKKTLGRKLLRIHVPFGVVQKVAQISKWLYRKSSKTPVIYPERLGELTAQNWGCDISKAQRMLAYLPKYNLATGLAESLLWYKKNNWF